jgi:hypothetical protein
VRPIRFRAVGCTEWFPPHESRRFSAARGRPGVRSGVHQGAHVAWRYCRRGRSRYISPAATSAQAERMLMLGRRGEVAATGSKGSGCKGSPRERRATRSIRSPTLQSTARI